MTKNRQININDTAYIQEDILSTVDLILKSTVGDVSAKIRTIINPINPKVRVLKNTIPTSIINKDLEQILTQDQKYELEEEYFNSLPLKTQGFITDHLSSGIMGTIQIEIDDYMRSNSVSSNKSLEVTITGKNLENEDIDETFEWGSIEELRQICQNLLDYHYLGLGLQGGILESIELYRPTWKVTDKKNPKKNMTKTKEVILFPKK